MKRVLLFVAAILLLPEIIFPQSHGVAINNTGATADSSAILDVSSTTAPYQGTLITRLSEIQRNAIINPAEGLLIFNTTTKCFNVYKNGGWFEICGNCIAPAAPTAANNGPVCTGTPLTLSATTIPGATYSWTGPNGFISALQNPLVSSSATSAMAGIYSVTAIKNNCVSAAGTTIVIVNTVPSMPGTITGNVSVCANSTGNIYSITSVPGATSYIWTLPAGASITANTGTSITVTFGSSSGNISVTAVDTCGTSNPASLGITVNPTPASTFTPTNVLVNTPTTFTPAVNGASYNWTFPGGTPGSSTAQNPVVTWTVSGTYNVTLTVALNGCSGTTTTAVIVSGPTVQTFDYTGAQQIWVVPAGVTVITVDVKGAQGYDCWSDGTWSCPPPQKIADGGKGGRVQATLNLTALGITPGSTLYIYVGGAGTGMTTGGWNGGANGAIAWGVLGGNGGGASDIRFGGTGLSDRILVAGGGGGASGDLCQSQVVGGSGGGLTGGHGGESTVNPGEGGQGGTQIAGGASRYNIDYGCLNSLGSPSCTYQNCGYAYPGTLGNGGASCISLGGGGGGGYYGGGAGINGGGGGGSSYVTPTGSSAITHTQGYQSGDGQVVITW